MRTPFRAMLWELWRTSRWELLCRLGWQCGLVFLLYILSDDVSEPEMNILRGIVILLLVTTSVFSMTWLSAIDSEDNKSGFSFRLGFTRPISTARLVTVPMLFSIVVAIGCYSLPAALFAALMDSPMPLAGPAMFVASAVATLVAAAWAPSNRIGKSLALAGLLAVLGFAMYLFHNSHHDPDVLLLAIGKLEYFQLVWYEYAALILVPIVAILFAIAAVDGQRHGDRWLDRFHSALSRQTRPTTLMHSTMRPFSSPLAAQCWYEMRRFGFRVLTLATLGPLLAIGVISGLLWAHPGWQGAANLALATIALCPIAYQLSGLEGAIGLQHKQGTVEYSAFDATRPMSNDQLITIKLFVVAACSLAGWLLMVMALGVHAMVAGYWPALVQIGDTVSSQLGQVSVYWWVAGLVNILLLYVSNSSVLLAFGLWLPLHPKTLVSAFFIVFLHLVLAAWDENHGWRLQLLWGSYGYILAIAIVSGSGYILWKALTAGYLVKPLFGFAFSAWVIYVLSSVAAYNKTASAVSIPLPVLFLGISLLFVPLATTALAPLALASHRHA